MAELANAHHCAIAELANDPIGSAIFTKLSSDDTEIRAAVPVLGSTVAVRCVPSSEGYIVGCVGTNAAALQWLNDVLITQASVEFDVHGNPMHALATRVPTGNVPAEMIRAGQKLLALRRQEEVGAFDPGTHIPMHWYSAKLNFGDWVGPQMVQAYSGRQPIQFNRPGTNARALFSVGSIAGKINRHNVDVWGSGLMRPLTIKEVEARKRLKGIKVHAVRGKLTRRELQDSLGWEVPEVYGDPALLLPDVIPPQDQGHGQVAVVPHYVHLPRIDHNAVSGRVVDVRNDVKTVVEEIAGAQAVVSSSLHGLIVAQAYGVPWVWLDVIDHQLGGKDFKFEDFFSCLDREAVSRIQVSASELASIDLAALGAKATLPALQIDLSLLRDAFPIDPVSGPLHEDFRARVEVLR